MPENMIVSSLVQGDIDKLRHCICGLIDEFYKKYNPSKSIDKSYITDLITEVHSCTRNLIIKLTEEF